MMVTLKKSSIYIIVALALGFGACGKYSQVQEPLQKFEKEAKPYVYGEVGGPAKQTKNTYTADPDLATKSAEIKDKLFKGKSTEKPLTMTPDTSSKK